MPCRNSRMSLIVAVASMGRVISAWAHSRRPRDGPFLVMRGEEMAVWKVLLARFGWR
jgi:hypothetical protein